MRRGWVGLTGSLAVALACGPSIEEGDGGLDGTGGDPTVGSASMSGASVDDTAGGGRMGSLGNGHGIAPLKILRGENETSDPTVGTARVEITLLYLECLVDFYESSPDWQQAGSEGAMVFDAALTTGLCDAADPELAPCTVADITQVMAPTATLTVGYTVTGSVENLELHFGPLPSTELSACADGGLPTVRMLSADSVRGLDASGTVLWTTEAFSPAETMTDQGLPLLVKVTRN